MASFDRNSHHAALYPDLRGMDSEMDDELEMAKQLSLITAAEDEERRQSRLCTVLNIAGRRDLVGPSSSQSFHESSSLPELLLDVERSAANRSVLVAAEGWSTLHQQQTIPGTVDRSKFSVPSQMLPNNMYPMSHAPPLPTVGPNASWNRSVGAGASIVSIQRSRPEIPPPPKDYYATSRSQSVSPPFRKSHLDVKNILLSPDTAVVGAGSEQDMPLINLSPPYPARGAQLDFDLTDLDPLKRPKSDIPAVPPSVPARPPNALSRLSEPGQVCPPISRASVGMNSTVNCTYGLTTGMQSSAGVVDNPFYGIWPPPHPAIPVVPYGKSLFSSAVANTTVAPAASPAFVSIASSRAERSNNSSPTPALPGVSSTCCTCTTAIIPQNSVQSRSSSFNRSSSLSSSTDLASPVMDNMPPSSIPVISGIGNDLMDFSLDSSLDAPYMTLKDFDPLYTTDNNVFAVAQSFDSNELFARSDHTRAPTCSHSALHAVQNAQRMPITQPNRDDSLPLQPTIDELQDPFSFHDLTISLENKRRRHAQEPAAASSQSEAMVVERTKPPLLRKMSQKMFEKSTYEMLEDFSETADDEIRAFLDLVKRIKIDDCDPSKNVGVIISPQKVCKSEEYLKLSVKVIVSGSFLVEPTIFTCDVGTVVSHIISRVLVAVTDQVTTNMFMLKVHGLSEYLINDSILGDYEYVQQCLKLDRDIKFVIVDADSISKPFLRTMEDKQCPPFVRKMKPNEPLSQRITKDKLNMLMETFYKEVEKLRDAVIQGSADNVAVCVKTLKGAVKALSIVLYQIETIDITHAVKRLEELVTAGQPMDSHYHVSEDSEGIHRVRVYYPSQRRAGGLINLETLHIALEDLTKAVKSLIDMYCKNFHTEFRFPTSSSSAVHQDAVDITNLRESLLLHIATAHRLPVEWKNIYVGYFVMCSVYHGSRKLGPDIGSEPRDMSVDGFPGTVVWDNWITFETVHMSALPRETRLCFTLVGVKIVPASTNETTHRVNVPLGWVNLQVYDHKFDLVQGSQLLCLWPNNVANPLGTNCSNTENPKAVLLQIDLPDFDSVYRFPIIAEPLPSLKQDFKSLHSDDQEYLQAIIEKDALARLTVDEADYLWEKRYYLLDYPVALPRVLQTVDIWSWSSLHEVYSMIREWAPMQPLESLQLLLSTYPDTYVRSKAVDQLDRLSPDEVYDLLPQLVQALKCESYHTSALARLLLEKSAANVRVAHYLYWLLKEAADDVHYRKRFQLLFGGLLSIVGEGMRKELMKQEEFIRMLSAIADKVKAGRDKEGILLTELHNMWDFFNYPTVRLPLNPALEVSGFDVQSCSFFTSFTCPLKLAMKNVDSSAGNIYAMFKAGDDLRQDMLTMQVIRIMDKLWLAEGLDLKMVTFRCQPTDLKKGVVELVMESDTLRKIQVKHGHGPTGSFKDRTIAEWLQVHNPTELDYQKAVNNFTESCAGYCVATYVLGLCDRHNDNIMIKHSGHIFHIDFAKFLGDAQTFGSFKRDRTPFVLTSDMAYVINGGDKPNERFQNFVDLCCRAFNIIRRNSNLFINLFSLMVQSGIPGVNANAPRYVQKVLLPDRTEFEAVAEFTRMINMCLQSIFTQFNFFVHNLAQLKFSGHDEGALLSFIPKTYTIHTDGRIQNLELYSIQKRYSPEKHYVYIIRVERENQRVASFVMRRYSEFQELHRKLVMTFPLVGWQSLSKRVILGRAHVRAVAEARREELQMFLKQLLTLSTEVAKHDLIYTFFHPMLKDEQDFDKADVAKLRDNSDQLIRQNAGRIDGSIKLNVFYRNAEMTVMVMHVKDLGPTANGEAPNPYVKLYLLPDPLKQTKRKTKIARNTYNPTYNEMFTYRHALEHLRQRTLQVSLWSYDALKENEFLGAVHLHLCDVDLTRADTTAWYRLQTLHVMTTP